MDNARPRSNDILCGWLCLPVPWKSTPRTCMTLCVFPFARDADAYAPTRSPLAANMSRGRRNRRTKYTKASNAHPKLRLKARPDPSRPVRDRQIDRRSAQNPWSISSGQRRRPTLPVRLRRGQRRRLRRTGARAQSNLGTPSCDPPACSLELSAQEPLWRSLARHAGACRLQEARILRARRATCADLAKTRQGPR